MECRIETKKIFILNENEIKALMSFIGEIPKAVALKQGIPEEDIVMTFKLYDQIMNAIMNAIN